MKDRAVQFIDAIDQGEVFDLKMEIVKDEYGKILSGLVIGNTLQQNMASILIAHPGEYKLEPDLGVGFYDQLLGSDLLAYRHLIKQHLAKDSLYVKKLDLYDIEQFVIEAEYE